MLPAPATAGAVIGLFTVIVTAAYGNDSVDGIGWWAFAAVGAMIAAPAVLIAGFALLRMRIRRLELDDQTLSHVDEWGRRTAIPRERIAAVYRGAAIAVAQALGPRPPGTAVVGAGRPSRSHQGGVLRAAADRAAYPGLRLPRPFTHPFAVAGVAVALVFAYVAGWIAVMMALISG